MEFVHLDLVDIGRRIYHYIASLIVFRECDVIAYGLLPAEQGAHAVETECKTSVRRSAELEGIDYESEFVLGFYGTLHCVELRNLQVVGYESPCEAIVEEIAKRLEELLSKHNVHPTVHTGLFSS